MERGSLDTGLLFPIRVFKPRMADLDTDTYILVCFIDKIEGVPHVMRCKIVEFEVTEAGGSPAPGAVVLAVV